MQQPEPCENKVHVPHDDIVIRLASFDDPEVVRLIEELDAYQSQMYPPESNYHDSATELRQPYVQFFGAHADDILVGIAAVKTKWADFGEVKRMYVMPEARGRGAAFKLLTAIEDYLRQRNTYCLRLETGNKHDRALKFYKTAGFYPCERYGDYRPDPLSVYLEKRF